MKLPDELREAIDDAVSGVPGSTLARASAELTERYRGEFASGARLTGEAQRLAYAVVRVPATYASVRAALSAVADRLPEGSVTSVLDLGAGPGTAAWAAVEVFPEIERVTLVERDPELIALGRRLVRNASNAALSSATWTAGDIDRLRFGPHDLVVASYVLGELEEPASRRVAGDAFGSAATALVVVEPGTPRGFERIRATRASLIDSGAHVVAPCPHDRECPMPEGDWCHFAARVERTALHRRLKGGEVGHEDEKYSYVAATHEPFEPAPARIMRNPLKREGHTYLDLCAGDGLTRIVVSRHDKAAHRRARKAKWGDDWSR